MNLDFYALILLGVVALAALTAALYYFISRDTQRYRDQFDKIEAACRDGGTSYHGCGVHPGRGA